MAEELLRSGERQAKTDSIQQRLTDYACALNYDRSNVPSAKGSPAAGRPMRVIALIDDPVVVREIRVHLGRWQPEARARAPPVPPEAWPAHATSP